MSYENWKDKIGTFEVMDVRGKKMDFFPALKAKAAALENGEGLHIIQSFRAFVKRNFLRVGKQAEKKGTKRARRKSKAVFGVGGIKPLSTLKTRF